MSTIQFKTSNPYGRSELFMNPLSRKGWFDSAIDSQIKSIRSSAVPHEVSESEENYLIKLSLPGFHKEMIRIWVDNKILHIASREEVKQKENEFMLFAFEKRFSIPEDAELDKVKAEFINGILQITLSRKKEEEKKASEIEII